MRPIYFLKDEPVKRKIMADMAFLVSHKEIRFPKWQYETDLYFQYKDLKSGNIEKFFLSPNNAFKEDLHFFYFKFPFKKEQVHYLAN